jgi:hypothetical protein
MDRKANVKKSKLFYEYGQIDSEVLYTEAKDPVC